MTVDRRAHLGARKIELGDVEGSLRLIVSGLRGEGGAMGLRKGFIRDRGGGKPLPPLVFLLPLVTQALGSGEGGFGVRERELETCLVDDEQHVAHLDALVVRDADVDHDAGDIRRHLHHIGAHPCVARPWTVFVSAPQEPACDRRSGEGKQGHGKTQDRQAFGHPNISS